MKEMRWVQVGFLRVRFLHGWSRKVKMADIEALRRTDPLEQSRVWWQRNGLVLRQALSFDMPLLSIRLYPRDRSK